jgi:hypothetical protein
MQNYFMQGEWHFAAPLFYGLKFARSPLELLLN